MRYCPTCHSVYPNEFRSCPRDQTELRAASELQPGMVLRGKYEILDKLGAGGMASVYRARHLAFGEVRAIKVVASRLADDEDFLRRFRNEAVVARRLQHPNAVRVDDLDTTEDGRPFIVMEYVEGSNLREVIRREGALGLRRSVEIARQVAAALSAAHELGIVHRDIKPDNILLTRKGEHDLAKVLDFGIAKAKEEFFGGDHVPTRTGTMVGTPQYISPEQAMGRRGDELDGRADLYSLGVVLYEMVTGRLPFESDTAMGVILQHLQTLPQPPHEVRPDLAIPEPLSAVLLQALQKDRERRFRTAGAMVAALDGVLSLQLPEPAPPAPPLHTPPPLRSPTPQPVPADIEERETKVMPRTPPVRTPEPPFSPPPLPPAAGAPTAMPTGVPTAIAAVVGAALGALGAAARGTSAPTQAGPTPPPLPSQGGFTPPPIPSAGTPPPGAPHAGGRPRTGRPKWLRWAIAGAVLFFVFGRRDREAPARRADPQVAASAAASTSAEDARLRDEVVRELKRTLDANAAGIEVEVEEADVRLSGRVGSRVISREAERRARRVRGVEDVTNDLEVVEGLQPRLPMPSGFPVIPNMPALERLRDLLPSAPAETVAELVNEGRRELEAGNYEEAIGIFQGALVLDPRSREAREGLQEAGRRLAERAREARPPRNVTPPPPPPSPPTRP